jgi:hypothetical protein
VADFDDRLEMAWHAIIEHIYTATEPPTERDVTHAGWCAIGEHVSSDCEFRGGEHGTVSPVRSRASDLRPQHRDLMPQHQDRRIPRGITTRQEHQPAENPNHEQVDEAVSTSAERR